MKHSSFSNYIFITATFGLLVSPTMSFNQDTEPKRTSKETTLSVVKKAIKTVKDRANYEANLARTGVKSFWTQLKGKPLTEDEKKDFYEFKKRAAGFVILVVTLSSTTFYLEWGKTKPETRKQPKPAGKAPPKPKQSDSDKKSKEKTREKKAVHGKVPVVVQHELKQAEPAEVIIINREEKKVAGQGRAMVRLVPVQAELRNAAVPEEVEFISSPKKEKVTKKRAPIKVPLSRRKKAAAPVNNQQSSGDTLTKPKSKNLQDTRNSIEEIRARNKKRQEKKRALQQRKLPKPPKSARSVNSEQSSQPVSPITPEMLRNVSLKTTTAPQSVQQPVEEQHKIKAWNEDMMDRKEESDSQEKEESDDGWSSSEE